MKHSYYKTELMRTFDANYVNQNNQRKLARLCTSNVSCCNGQMVSGATSGGLGEIAWHFRRKYEVRANLFPCEETIACLSQRMINPGRSYSNVRSPDVWCSSSSFLLIFLLLLLLPLVCLAPTFWAYRHAEFALNLPWSSSFTQQSRSCRSQALTRVVIRLVA